MIDWGWSAVSPDHRHRLEIQIRTVATTTSVETGLGRQLIIEHEVWSRKQHLANLAGAEVLSDDFPLPVISATPHSEFWGNIFETRRSEVPKYKLNQTLLNCRSNATPRKLAWTTAAMGSKKRKGELHDLSVHVTSLTQHLQSRPLQRRCL